ncbi:MAG: GTP-binding protein [Candidatus Thorarchaeota archaeon]|nr:GTP-binding protein [Candidatus Thorarchaeota archaeon]
MDSYIYKVCVVGDPGVGKSATVLMWSSGSFHQEYQLTVGVQHFTRSLNISSNAGVLSVKLILWDIGGQATFKMIRPMFYKAARGVVVMFDLTNRASFEGVTNWIREADSSIGRRVPIVLVGNKADLPSQVTIDEVKRLAQQIGAVPVVSSAKTGSNVADIFQIVAEMISQENETLTTAAEMHPARTISAGS